MNVSTDNLQWHSHIPQSDSACNPSPQPHCHQPLHSPKYVYTSHLERTITHTKYVHLYPDNQNSRWVVDQWCPRSFCSLSKDDTHASRYHGIWMYSINADDFHSLSQCLEAGSLTPNLTADFSWASELHRMPKPIKKQKNKKKKPKQSAAQRMILSKSCETRDHRMSLLWE